jgi:hypothetical protein
MFNEIFRIGAEYKAIKPAFPKINQEDNTALYKVTSTINLL